MSQCALQRALHDMFGPVRQHQRCRAHEPRTPTSVGHVADLRQDEVHAGIVVAGTRPARRQHPGHPVQRIDADSGVVGHRDEPVQVLLEPVELAEEHGWYLCRQFENEANAEIHTRTTAREILSDFLTLEGYVVRTVEDGEAALRELGLKRDDASTQIVQRDRHAAFLGAIAVAGGSIERFAVEIRNLQHTEIAELQEPFRSGQKGSSAMPHKRNPIATENLSGCARLMRSTNSVDEYPRSAERRDRFSRNAARSGSIGLLQ